MSQYEDLIELVSELDVSKTERDRLRRGLRDLAESSASSTVVDRDMDTGPVDLGVAETIVHDGDPDAAAHLPETGRSSVPETGETFEGRSDGASEAPGVFAMPEAYEWESFIEKGGMGEIHLVRERSLNRHVVMKVLRSDQAASDVGVSRFVEEAQITAQLDHHGIPPVYDFGRLPDDRLYYTMKALGRRTLGDVIDRVHDAFDGDVVEKVWEGWSLRGLLEVVAEICETVAYAHRHGIVHRDLKPANIMVGDFGSVHVIDWGIARVLDREESDDRADRRDVDMRTLRSQSPDAQTLDGTLVGTASYMAPEQVRGHREAIAPATDVFALGAILYEVLVGEPAFDGNSQLDTLMQVLDGPDRPPEARPWVSEELGRICAKALDPASNRRFDEALPMYRRLEDWMEGRRARQQADELLAEAEQLAPEIARTAQRAEMFNEEFRRQLQSIPPSAPVEAKVSAWELETRAEAERWQVSRLEAQQLGLLESALSGTPEYEPVHSALASHYRRRHERALREESDRQASKFETHLERHDRDGTHAGYLEGKGRLSLGTDPQGARVRVFRYRDEDRQRVASFERELARTPLAERKLPSGQYLLKLRAPDRAEVSYPVEIRREQHWNHRRPGDENATILGLPRHEEIPDASVYVPEGWFLCGRRSGDAKSLPRRRLWLDGFFVQRDPVDHRMYLEFLNDLVEDGRREEAEAHAPRRYGGIHRQSGEIMYGRRPDGGFILHRDDFSGLEADWPVFLVNWHDARAFARWYSRQTGRSWRLPSEFEWEKAARGVDGRRFPWGDHFDANWCCMADSCAEAPSPAAPEAFEADVSPYGARAMAGTVSEWCLEHLTVGEDERTTPRPNIEEPDADAGGMRVYRGGAWSSERWSCQSFHRAGLPPDARLARVGFRLVTEFDG